MLGKRNLIEMRLMVDQNSIINMVNLSNYNLSHAHILTTTKVLVIRSATLKSVIPMIISDNSIPVD